MAAVTIPTPLRPHTGNLGTVEAEGSTVAEVLDHLGERYPELRKRLFAADGDLNAGINIYLNNEDIRFLDDLATPVGPRDEVSLIPNIAGG